MVPDEKIRQGVLPQNEADKDAWRKSIRNDVLNALSKLDDHEKVFHKMNKKLERQALKDLEKIKNGTFIYKALKK